MLFNSFSIQLRQLQKHVHMPYALHATVWDVACFRFSLQYQCSQSGGVDKAQYACSHTLCRCYCNCPDNRQQVECQPKQASTAAMQQSRQPQEDASTGGGASTGGQQLDSDLASLLSQLNTTALAERGLREILTDNRGNLPPLEGRVFDELAAAVAIAVNSIRGQDGGPPEKITGDYLTRVAEVAVKELRAT